MSMETSIIIRLICKYIDHVERGESSIHQANMFLNQTLDDLGDDYTPMQKQVLEKLINSVF